MQVKSIEMTLTKLDKVTIEEFMFKAQIACRDLKNLNPAIWIAEPILKTLLKQANKDITESMKSSSGQPRYFKYSRLTADDLYVKIGERSPTGNRTVVMYIVQVMTRCIVDTKHLFENCLLEFQSIDCRGISITLIRGMHSKVVQTMDHWTVTMGYTIEVSLAKEIIKSLNSKIQGKLFETNFFRNLLHNRSECRKQALEEKKKFPQTMISRYG